jgi:hypothetical protein
LRCCQVLVVNVSRILGRSPSSRRMAPTGGASARSRVLGYRSCYCFLAELGTAMPPPSRGDQPWADRCIAGARQMNNDDEIDPAAVVRFLKATGFSNLAAAFESFERMTAPQRRRRSRRQCTTRGRSAPTRRPSFVRRQCTPSSLISPGSADRTSRRAGANWSHHCRAA